MKQDVKDTLGRAMRDLRISVTDRCNFRCPYCMPLEIYGERYNFLPKPDILTFEEIIRLTKRRISPKEVSEFYIDHSTENEEFDSEKFHKTFYIKNTKTT